MLRYHTDTVRDKTIQYNIDEDVGDELFMDEVCTFVVVIDPSQHEPQYV